jgi:GABA permease
MSGKEFRQRASGDVPGPNSEDTPAGDTQTLDREEPIMSDTISAGSHQRLHSVRPSRGRRVLVVANQTASSPALISALRERAEDGPVSFHLIVPALNTRLRHWLSDTDGAVSAARGRGNDALATLTSHGLTVSMEIGDSVPLLAIDDALAQFHVDEIVISTLPPDQSHWLEHDLVQLTRRRFNVPVRHVVADDDVELAA